MRSDEHGQGQGHGGGLHEALSAAGAHWQAPAPRDLLLALDDTDNLDSPGTGFRARELACLLAEARLGRPTAITRHQLLVDPRIPYTSHNSSACIVLTGVADERAVFDGACRYLRETAAAGSDVGVVQLRRAGVRDALVSWGRRAQREVLALGHARALAADSGAAHAELSGTGGGLIGALAALGLHATGYDGRLLWLRALRELTGRMLSVAELVERTAVSVQTLDGRVVEAREDLVDLGAWPRAVYRYHQPVLLVEPADEPASHLWRCVARDVVKRF